MYSTKVTIPKTWTSGAKKVLFVASDGIPTADSGVKVQGMSLSTQDDEVLPEAVEFHIEPGDYDVVQTRTDPDQDLKQSHMETLHVDEARAYGDFDWDDDWDDWDDDWDDWDDDFSSSAAPSNSDSNTSTSISPSAGSGFPKTGDALPFGLLGAALAAAGAATVAYERRRAQNEAAAAEAEDAEEPPSLPPATSS